MLAADFPSVPEFIRGLAMALNNLGILFKDAGRAEEAEEMYRQAMVIHKKLAADFPDVADHRNEAGGAILNLARMFLIGQDFDQARQLLIEAEPHHKAALAASPDNPVYRKFYRLNRWRLAEACIGLGDHVAAAGAVEQFLEFSTEPPRDAYIAATLLASCVRLAAQDETLADDRRQAIAIIYGDRALDSLRRAIELNAEQVAEIGTDPALDSLRSRVDFDNLLPIAVNKQ
jgi:tetratricopeptide (TPR) repeat protein